MATSRARGLPAHRSMHGSRRRGGAPRPSSAKPGVATCAASPGCWSRPPAAARPWPQLAGRCWRRCAWATPRRRSAPPHPRRRACACSGSRRCARSPWTPCARCASRSTHLACPGPWPCAPATPAPATDASRAKAWPTCSSPRRTGCRRHPDTTAPARTIPACARWSSTSGTSFSETSVACCCSSAWRAHLGPVGDAGQPR